MRENKVGAIVIKSFALLVVLGTAYQAMAQDAPTPYPKMAPIDQYLMEKNAEIQLARSAAPESISRDATILILGRQGYETAVQGKNGFVCLVGRAWGAAFDWAEFWNPKVKAADCLNPQAARSILPIAYLRARMVMAGRSKAEIVSAVKAAFESKQLPDLESGAMDYMMSKSAYLTDEGDHNMPHLMFYTLVKDGKDWGSGAAGSPVLSSPYWFFSPKEQPQMKGLPPILVFLVAATNWSDGTPADATTRYSKMAPVDQYFMADREAEIALARSAAPESIARDAEVSVLGRHGFETAVKGKNGFVCIVGRSWASAADEDYWDPKVRVPMCVNAAAARSYLLRITKITDLALAGRTLAQVNEAMAPAIEKKELPPMEPGAMCYMMSKQGYGGDSAPHWPSHLMFFFSDTDPAAWGANLPGSPVIAVSDPAEHLTQFVIQTQRWSDGTEDLPASPTHVHQ